MSVRVRAPFRDAIIEDDSLDGYTLFLGGNHNMYSQMWRVRDFTIYPRT